jgi:hypothetical protein
MTSANVVSDKLVVRAGSIAADTDKPLAFLHGVAAPGAVITPPGTMDGPQP